MKRQVVFINTHQPLSNERQQETSQHGLQAAAAAVLAAAADARDRHPHLLPHGAGVHPHWHCAVPGLKRHRPDAVQLLALLHARDSGLHCSRRRVHQHSGLEIRPCVKKLHYSIRGAGRYARACIPLLQTHQLLPEQQEIRQEFRPGSTKGVCHFKSRQLRSPGIRHGECDGQWEYSKCIARSCLLSVWFDCQFNVFW